MQSVSTSLKATARISEETREQELMPLHGGRVRPPKYPQERRWSQAW